MSSGFVEKIESAEQRSSLTSADPVGSGSTSAEPTSRSTAARVITTPAPTTDILLIGRAGMGKSTTGNKLLQAGGHKPKEWFEVSQNTRDIIKGCELLSNDTASIRIVELASFHSSDVHVQMSGLNPYLASLGIIRKIVTVQAEYKLRFHRILYFIPTRGELPRADAIFKEELEIMYYFFGDAIFQNMILVATVRPKKSKKNELDDQDLKERMATFRSAYEAVTNETSSNISYQRRAIYISLEDTPNEILKAIMTRGVGIPDGIQLEISRSICAKCALKLDVHNGHDMEAFTYCKPIKYEDTKCHPFFVRKWSRAARRLGGIANIVSFGLAYALGAPWFTDATEICTNCGNIPGTEGCAQVETVCVTNLGEMVIVKHTNKVL